MASPIPLARRAEALAALAALRLPRAALVRLTGGTRIARDGGVLDEQVQGLLAAIRLVGAAPLAGDDLEAARDVFDVEARMLITRTPQLPFVRDEVVSPRDPVRPDGFYGLSKAFGENLAQMYWDRHGIETVSLRIGSSFEAPKDRRMLATWMSFDDTERLVAAALGAPIVGHTVIYGMSDNATRWWDNTPASHIGYRPKDSSEQFRAEVEARQQSIDRNARTAQFQGGAFVEQGYYD